MITTTRASHAMGQNTSMQTSKQKNRFSELRQRLRDPLRLRVVITGLVLAVGYVGIYMPLGGRVEELRRDLSGERTLQSLATDAEYLRAQVDMFQDRLPKDADTNEWVQYVLEGTRQFPLKLINMDSDKPKRVGPYQAVALRVELEGAIHDLESFLYWLETNQRLFRVESAKIAPAREECTALVMQLTVLGLNG